MFPQLDTLVAMGKAETIIPGTCSSYRILHEDKELFYKVIGKRPFSMLKSLERPVIQWIKHKNPQLKTIDYCSKEHIDKERRTIRKWAAAGLPVIMDKDHDDNSIIYPYVEMDNVSQHIHKNPSAPINELLDTMAKTRELAFAKNDSDYLHSDPHLENFLYDEQQGKVIPIDPGLVFKKDVSLEEIDASNNLHFLYSFFRLRLPKENITNYLEKSTEIFEPCTRKMMYETNNENVPFLGNAYLLLREVFVSAIKGRGVMPLEMLNNHYTRKNRDLVNDILTS